MKLSLISLAVVASLAMGCAGNQALRSQVDTLQQRSQEQDKQIQNLQAELAKSKKENDNCSLSGAWNWVTSHTQEAWDSPTSQEARARFNKMLEDLKKPSAK
jgi:hypothetical protein